MKLQIIKFGNILNSRPAGREAVLRAKQILNDLPANDDIILDFSHVEILTPSYADEFVKGLKQEYSNNNIQFEGIDNVVIKDTLTTLDLIK